MLEMTAEAIVIAPELTTATTECELCYSLQPCIVGYALTRCADWHACRARQQENKQEPVVKLTDADVAGLLECMEIMTADMERLKQIESAARVFVQASEAFDAVRGHGPIIQLHTDLIDAERKLIAAVKDSK